jgi:hypothetical protein
MTFNIGSQSGGTFNNVAGNQYVSGGQQTFVQPAEAALRDLQDALRQARLDPHTAGRASTEVAEMTDAVHATPPDQGRVARAAERLTDLMKAAGSLAPFIAPLSALAAWLGPIGTHLAGMLTI